MSSDPALRSLVQKAVRRGYPDVVNAVVDRLAERGDSSWLRSRAAVIAFEECWPCVARLSSEGMFDPLKLLMEATQLVKHKDAAGLGSLAFAFSEGHTSAMNSAFEPKAVRIVAAAYARPLDFFKWARLQCATQNQKNVVEVASQSLAGASWGWDKTCILAGAYLSCISEVPEPAPSFTVHDTEFPYWVALDKHTPQGKRLLLSVANELAIPVLQMQWASFYFESAVTDVLSPSNWWESEREWRLRSVGLTLLEAQAIWVKASPIVKRRIEAQANLLKASVSAQTFAIQASILR